MVATTSSSATGTLSNTAVASASDATTVTATDTDTLGPKATLTITKTDNDGGSSSPVRWPAVPGSITYTIVVSNSGPSMATGAIVIDPLPSPGHRLRHLDAEPARPGSPFNASAPTPRTRRHPWPGPVRSPTPWWPSSSPRPPAPYANTATASATDATPVTATDTDSLDPQATLAITKTDGVTSVVAGTTDTYTIVVSNSGPSTPPT